LSEPLLAQPPASNKNDDAEAVLALVAKVSAVLNEIDSEIIDISDDGKTILKTPARKGL